MSILQTQRLLLREMSLGDLDFIAAMLADPEVMRYYPKCYSRDEAAEWIERQQRRYSRHRTGLFLVEDRIIGTPIGQAGLVIQNIRGTDEREVGYLIHRPYWRQGYAYEAALACGHYAFHQLNRQRLFALIRPENTPSLGLARKLGMMPETATIMHSSFVHQVFSISAAQWHDRMAANEYEIGDSGVES